MVAILTLSGCSSPLVRAAKKGSADEVRALVPGDRKHCGEALRAAAANNREPVVKALLDGGCEVNAKDKDGYTPLMMAAAKGHDDVVRLLLLRKADADLVTWNDKTAAMLAADNRHKDTARLIENLDRSLNPEVAAMVAASPPATGGFLDNVIDAAASGAAQTMIQGAMSGKVPDMNSIGQGALRGALNGDSGGASQGLLNAAAGGAMGGAMRNLGGGSQKMLRAAATGAAVEAAGSLLAGSPSPASAPTASEVQPALSPAPSEPTRLVIPLDRTPQANVSGLQDALASSKDRRAGAATPRREGPRRSASIRVVSGQQGHEELLALVQRLGDNDIAWNLPQALLRATRGGVKVGDVFGPALDDNRKGAVMFNFEDTPLGRIEKWSERAAGRSFFMYWILNPLGNTGERMQGGPGTIAYLETSLPLPLRRHVVVVAQYQGLKTFRNAYGEESSVPFLKVIAAATTNDYYYIGSDWTTVDANVEFYFDDRALTALEKRLKPLDGSVAAATEPNPDVAEMPGVEAKAVAPPPSRSKDCAALTKILASRDDIAAQHGEVKAARVMEAAKRRYEESKCTR